MEANRRPLRHGALLSLRSREDLELLGEVVGLCSTHGVRHQSFLREALRHALGEARVLEAAKRRDVDTVVRRRAVYRDRMRWYRGRKLI